MKEKNAQKECSSDQLFTEFHIFSQNFEYLKETSPYILQWNGSPVQRRRRGGARQRARGIQIRSIRQILRLRRRTDSGS